MKDNPPQHAPAQVLLELVERCERAEPGEQRALLLDVWDELNPQPPAIYADRTRDHADALFRFIAMLNAAAYESAALTLVPEGWTRLCDNTDVKEVVELYPHGPVDEGTIERGGHPTSFALALCAAALRALASMEKQS